MITLKQNNGQLIAMRGGTALICPFAGGVPKMQNNQFGPPEMVIERLPCGSHCPHFDLQVTMLWLRCGNNKDFTTVTIEKEQTPLNALKLV